MSAVALASSTSPPAVHVDGLTRIFSGRRVIDDLSLSIPRGQFVALIGKSGSGKSTLLKALADLDDDVEGHGHVDVPTNVSVLFQDSRLLPWETAHQNVTLGLRASDAAERGRRALADVGLAGREDAWPGVLSGGEQQRVALARSLAREPELLLADEPFGALDALTRGKMHELLLRLIDIHRPTTLLVTHDVDEAVLLADRVLVMESGRFLLDRRIDLPRTDRRGAPSFEATKRALLAAL